MTVPVHSVKHIKAEYHRYQLMAIVSVTITIVAIILSAVTSFQVAHLGKQRAEAQSAFQIRADEILQRDTTTLQERIAEIEQQLVAEKTLVQQLNSRIATLQKRLNDVKSVGDGAVGSELQSPDQIKAVPVTADDTSKPVRGWTPTVSTPKPVEVKATAPEIAPVPAPKPTSEPELNSKTPAPTSTAEPENAQGVIGSDPPPEATTP
jgi:hypothetical protein